MKKDSKIEELFGYRLKFPGVRQRNENWNEHDVLEAGIKRVLESGKEEYIYSPNELMLYRIQPNYPLTEDAMNRPENQGFLKVRVSVFSLVFNLGVHEGSKWTPDSR